MLYSKKLLALIVSWASHEASSLQHASLNLSS